MNIVIDAIGVRLATLADVNVSTEHPDRIAPPHIVIGMIERIDYHETASQATGQLIKIQFPIFAYVSRADALDGQRTLKAFQGTTATSVHNVLSGGDRTYGGTFDSILITPMTQSGRYTIAGVNYLGCEWQAEVLAVA